MNVLSRSRPHLATAPAVVRDPLWYKDAIIYQTHVKAFLDADGDGVGDFAGLIEKLDYVADLGATAIWLLPFYPSPLRDDGYDIADYRSINPAYGSMRDFRRFVAESHRRGLRVITELVINHTSDRHPWFVRARKARRGSPWRDFYVWSDDDKKYAGTRIIFLDTEKSNWTWDPEAQAYFWHRFYSHQPDLNFDNPRVLDEVKKVLHFWLDLGVDGMRLDAVPYLIERDGTNNENLPETHEVLKRLRAEVDAHYPDRMLLAEANQWPEDTCPYFGDGDECHMAFHFPLMPRMYMALAQEDRHPITDIIRQTPDIPDSCQWAIFLRNHDELTLEMVTDRERDYLWQTYANENRARINLGIRRRLAPLLENDRRKIELLNGLLMSMPGTPVIYYGDEIGMGDNIYLGDRDGVRTPMQWSADRNGGFSRANPQRLFLPPIMDPVYGYEAINVEAQQANPASLLNWMRRLVGVRKAWHAFGRGSLALLYPANRKVLAYVRSWEDETILCVANLSRAAQAVELDLSAHKGRVPVELLSRSPFPPIGELPYLLTLAPYGFYWFSLAEEAALPAWHIQTAPPLPEFSTIVVTSGWRSIVDGRGRQSLEQEILPAYLRNKRWFAGKDARRIEAQLAHAIPFAAEDREFLLAELDVRTSQTGSTDRYFLPLAFTWGEDAITHGSPILSESLARIRRGPRIGALHEAVVDDAFVQGFVQAMREDWELSDGSTLRFRSTPALRAQDDLADLDVRRLGGEQTNTTVLVGDRLVMKIYRRLEQGVQPELEVSRFLTQMAGFAHTPALLGWAERDATSETITLAVAFEHVPNQGDAWQFTLDWVDRFLEGAVMAGHAADDGLLRDYLDRAELLGRRTAEMHRAFATPNDDPAFAPEPIVHADIEGWIAAAEAQVEEAFDALEDARAGLDGLVAEDVATLAALRGDVRTRLRMHADIEPQGMIKTRLHGDYHLGQVLVAQEDFAIIDFEGEPRASLEERRRKGSPLRDVAGMLRSFDYAAWTAVDRFRLDTNAAGLALETVRDWRKRSSTAFLEGYRQALNDGHEADLPDGDLLDLFLLQKAFYEIRYEVAHRPRWLHVPVRGVLELLEQAGTYTA